MKIKLTLFFLFFGSLLAAQTGASSPGVRDLTCPSISSGSSTAYACNLLVAPSAYVTNATYGFKADATNSGAATLNLNSLGAKSIVKLTGAINTALNAGDIRTGQEVILKYDGTNMQMMSPLGNAGATGGCVSIGTNLQNGDGTGGCADSTLVSTDVARLSGTQSITGQKAFSLNGAASASSVLFTGTWFTGGTGTTNFPLIKIEVTGTTAPTTWSTTGTGVGINAPAGCGNLFVGHVNGAASIFSVSCSGSMTASANLQLGGGASSFIRWGATTKAIAPSDGLLQLTNNAQTSFTRLQLGLTTDSGPAFCISGTVISVCGGAGGAVGSLVVPGAITVASCTGCGVGGGTFYQTLLNNGTPVTQRVKLNIVGGTFTDNGTDTTTVTVTGGSGVAKGTLASRPGTCADGDQYNVTDNPLLQMISVCKTNAWTTYINVDATGLLITAGTLGIDLTKIPTLASANAFTGAISAPTLTGNGLTSGNCVQAGTGGVLTTIASQCAGLAIYTQAGTLLPTPKLIEIAQTLIGGTATVTFGSGFTFASTVSYSCVVSDASGNVTLPTAYARVAANQITITGNGTSSVTGYCIGI